MYEGNWRWREIIGDGGMEKIVFVSCWSGFQLGRGHAVKAYAE